MAIIYVRSTDGNDSDNGSTWALAKATLGGAAAIDASGDTVYVSDNHSESAASPNFGFAQANIIGADDSAEPPTASSTAATFSYTGNAMIYNPGGLFYGLKFAASSSSNGYFYNIGGMFESCTFDFASSATGHYTILTGVRLYNCSFKFGESGQMIGNLDRLTGGSFLSGTTSPTKIFKSGSGVVESFDMSQCSSTVDIHSGGGDLSGLFILRNCKLPDSWTGDLINAAITAGSYTRTARIEMWNCDSGDTNYRLWIEAYQGSIKHSATIYNNAGATDGTQRISWQMVTNTVAVYPMQVLRSPEIVVWNDSTGSSKTVSVEVVFDGATDLDDDEIWLEVQYLGTSTRPLGTMITDRVSDIIGTPTAQANGSATWTGTSGFTNENKHTLSVSITPQEKGYIHAVVCLAKASTTVYVDPLLTVA